jgi:phasin family protein
MPSFSDNPALRAHLESQVDFMNEFTQKMYDTLRQLSELNLRLTRQGIEGSIHASREMLSCTDPMQCAQVAMKQIQPATERIRAYQQHLLSVLAGAQANFARSAETRIPEASRSASAVADEMVRQASAGADEVVRQASAGTNVPVTGPGSATPNGPMPSPSPGAAAGGKGSAGEKPH